MENKNIPNHCWVSSKTTAIILVGVCVCLSTRNRIRWVWNILLVDARTTKWLWVSWAGVGAENALDHWAWTGCTYLSPRPIDGSGGGVCRFLHLCVCVCNKSSPNPRRNIYTLKFGHPSTLGPWHSCKRVTTKRQGWVVLLMVFVNY